MHNVGELLKQKRIEKKLSLDDAERDTKIRKKFLLALEANAFDELPGTAYIVGFLKNYSRYLGLDSTVILALFRREYDEKKRIPVLPTNNEQPFGRAFVLFTPRLFATVTAIAVLVFFLGYLLFEYRFAVGAPSLVIESPQNNLILTDDKVTIRGRTDPDVKVTINGGEVPVQVDGSFFQDVSALLGTNTYTITATNKFGKKSSTVVVVERGSP